MITLNPSADTRILNDAPTTNYGTIGTLEVGEMFGQVSTRHTLIKFNLAPYTGKNVISATLRLYDTGDDYTNNARTMNVYRSKRAWTEAGATWNTYDGSNGWGTVGSGNSTTDYDNKVVGSVLLPNPPVAGYVEVSLNKDYINEWLNGTMVNNGFVLFLETESDDAHQFNSNEAASNKPELVLNFSEGYSYFM